MSTTIVSSGVISTGLTVSSGDVVSVMSGGVIAASTVLNGGLVFLASGGVDGAPDNVGSITIAAGGVLSGDGAIHGYNIVHGTVSGHLVLVGGNAYEGVLRGGTDVGTIIEGDQNVGFGGVTIGDDLVGRRGFQDVRGGRASGTRVGSASEQFVVSGGSSVDTTVLNGGLEAVVVSDSIASRTTIRSGGSMIVNGAVATNTVILAGGVAQVWLSGSANSTLISSGGVLAVSSGGSAFRTVVASGGEQLSQGLTSNTVVSGVESVSALGVDHHADVRSGGLLELFSRGSSISAFDRLGGTVSVFSGGIDIATSAYNGGAVFVGNGGVTSDVQVLGGGERVLPGGTEIGTVVSGGLTGIMSGGTASGLTLSAGGQLTDNGLLVMSGTHALSGSLFGFGAISETAGTLTLSGAGSAFTGQANIDSGTWNSPGLERSEPRPWCSTAARCSSTRRQRRARLPTLCRTSRPPPTRSTCAGSPSSPALRPRPPAAC
jgi:autotransporter passenger strand-loop-strand repeat protein